VSAIPSTFADALRERYLLERQLGQGGMATVYLARDLKHDRFVALKVIRPELSGTLGPDRFLQEIRLAARLQHPHILTVFDSGESGGRLWFTMPYVEGESLRDRLRREQVLPQAEALRIAREAGQALQYAHDHGVVHRDIKPENILLTRDGNTLVADFGIARSPMPGTPHLTATGMIIGTPSYMSPEQAVGETGVDGRSDVYSLGCVLYEMLTGAPPFTGSTAHRVIAQHLGEPPSLASSRIPRDTAAALAQALAKEPADRFQTATEFVSALSHPAGAPRRRSAARLAIIGLGAAAIVIAAVLIGHWLGSRGGTSNSVTPGHQRRLSPVTDAAGVEEWPAWSPDGKRLAYSGDADGFKQLFVRTLATGEERRLTRGQQDDIQPAWSPDGRRLAFVRAAAAGGKLEPSDINGWYFEGGDVWLLDLESRQESKLVEGAFGPSWSPDGKRLAFDAGWAGPHRIWVSDARGLNPRQITADSNDAAVHAGARWSPDGSHIVFRRIEKTQWDIAVADAATSAVTRLTNDIIPDIDPTWAPDGRHIYFSSARGGGLNLWRLPIEPSGALSGPAEQLTTGAGDDVQPTPSPDGRRLAFAIRGIDSDIWRLPVSPGTGRVTGDPQPVVVTARVQSRGAWSPDGRTIAYNSDRRGDMNLWLRSLADGSERQLTSGPGGDYQPNWSPDGRTIAFFSARSGNPDIWAVQVSDGALSRLTQDPGTDNNPFFSPDGRLIAFLSDRSGRSEAWLMNVDGSNQRRIYDGAAGGHFLRWTADGKSIVFRSERGVQTQVLAAPIAGGAAVKLPEIASGAHMSFSPSGKLILDVRGHKALWVHPLDGTPPYKVFEFHDPDVRIDYPVWSPDGRWVLFDRAAPRSGDVWMLEGAE
jgi:eukaryotic-like serine/threonine-protein kinase